MTHPILVTGAAGRVGGVGGLVVEALQRRGLPVRAMVSFPGSYGPSFWS
jgi:NAD(P)H dehydrogenase (quinone)